jgi:5-methyltetrahydrofolate--homocysteine methyltransferase
LIGQRGAINVRGLGATASIFLKGSPAVMSDRLKRLLATRPWLLADGATGTNYFAAGLEVGGAPELWNLSHPERVAELHRGFLEAGADIILTNTFGGSRYRLKLHGAQDRVGEINRRAAEIARAEADKQDREVVVAGSIGPTGEILEPVGALGQADARAAFAEQALALAAGGADVIWIETISSIEELTAAVAGAEDSSLPVVCTLSFDTNGRTMMGVRPAEVAALMGELSPRPLAYGGNCGVGAAELVAVIVNMAQAARPDDVLVAKSNCGVPEFVDGEIRYNGTPELMADYARLARDAGVRIIGGCCGTTPAHLRAMAAALEAHQPREAPSLETVVARLGPITAGAMGAEPASTGAERRRSRRRSGTPSA